MEKLSLIFPHKNDIILIMKTTFKIINGNLCEYDANGNFIHYKNSDGLQLETCAMRPNEKALPLRGAKDTNAK